MEVKDKDRIIYTGLRAAGFEITERSTQLILQVVDFVRDCEAINQAPTLRDITTIKSELDEYYKEKENNEQ